ncbi:MAG: aspartate carbamoyltransferase catalytic subunit [Wenzhouxiangellaceae bacterium]
MTTAAISTTPPPRLPHLLDIASLDEHDVHTLISLCHHFERHGPTPLLTGKTVAILFFEASTRTRVSFELALRRLGAEVVIIQGAGSSATKGETLQDTMLTLAAMDVDAIILRHPESGTAAELARTAPDGMAIINAGDGAHEHPSQALIDAYTLHSAGIGIPGSILTIVGDLRHSRVARSNIALWHLLGAAEIRIAGPAAFLPEQLPPGPVKVFTRFDDALPDSDAIMMLRIQRERMSGINLPDRSTYHNEWGLSPQRLQLTPAHCRVLHPGPLNRGVEIDSSVADGDRSLIIHQVRSGVYMRMAILVSVLLASTDLPLADSR